MSVNPEHDAHSLNKDVIPGYAGMGKKIPSQSYEKMKKVNVSMGV